MVGHSAGAHVIMQLLSDPLYLAEAGMTEEQVSKSIKGAVGISGVYNIVRVANTAVFGSLVVRECSVLRVIRCQADFPT